MLTHATRKEVGKGSKIYLEVGTGKTDRKLKEKEREREKKGLRKREREKKRESEGEKEGERGREKKREIETEKIKKLAKKSTTSLSHPGNYLLSSD
jgi:hypothetical protein